MKTKILISILVGLLVIPFVSAVLAIPANDNAAGVERVPVLIGFTQTPGRSEQALVRGHGGVIKYSYHLVPAIAASIPKPAIEGLLHNPNVTRIEPDGTFLYLTDAELDNSWGVERIGAGVVHAAGNKGQGVKVAVLDSGIDYTHPDLDDNYAGGYDFMNDDDDPMDDLGHGTHVAGIIAAEDNDVRRSVVGVAPEAELYALKVGDQYGVYYSNVIAALEWAAENGMQVTNNSYGSLEDPGETLKLAFDKAYAAGIVHVCAAGNSGSGEDTVLFPAKYECCIAVAATDKSDMRAGFSSTGPDVEISAPGVSIRSTLLYRSRYGTKSGTSMASPHVAGVVALMIADGGYSRETLWSTADDLGEPGRDPQYGYGLVNAAAAVGISENNPPTVSITSPTDGSTFESGTTINFSGTASDAEDGDLTDDLVWTSDIVGQIGTGGIFSTTLSDGNHTITASVTDSGDKSASDSISITVGTPTEPTTVSVDSITYSTQGGKDGEKHLNITVALVDDLGNPVAGASVSSNLNLDGSLYAQGTGITGTDGTLTYRLKNAPSGYYTTNVTNVSAEELTWDGLTPDDGYGK